MTGWTTGWVQVPLWVRVDLRRGGRWTSLASPAGAGGREWLWHHPSAAVRAARGGVAPGSAFVDAGGGEECLPTVDGEPDHGAVWCVPWHGDDGDGDGGARAVADGLEVRRRLTAPDGAVRADYSLRGTPGRAVLHALHLLLDLSPAARVELPGAVGAPCAVRDESGALGRWRATWPPTVGKTTADRLGPDDGSATAVCLPRCDRALVVDGDHALELRWRAAGGQPSGLLLWRNLRGWPAASPYRSTGVEPLLGSSSDLAECERAGGRGAAHLDAEGAAAWSLQVRALRREPSAEPPGGSARTSIPDQQRGA